MAVMLPSLREETRANLFAVPADRPKNRHRLAGAGRRAMTPRRGHHLRNAGARVTTPVTGGHCKLQWKPDWAMRWVALGVDYEMAGKDLIDSVSCRAKFAACSAARRRMDSTTSLFPRRERPENLEVEGQRPDHRRWLRYASPESLSAVHVSRAESREAAVLRRSSPRHVDDYLQFLDAYPRQAAKERLGNPVLAHSCRRAAGA